MDMEHSIIVKVVNMWETGNKIKCMAEELSITRINKLHMKGNGRMISCMAMEYSIMKKLLSSGILLTIGIGAKWKIIGSSIKDISRKIINRGKGNCI